MFEYIYGKLVASSPQKATVDVGGIGYLIEISLATFEKLPQAGAQIKLFTSFVVKEDSQRLFGFLTVQDRDFFQSLCDISGIGPRLALSILGHMSLSDLHSCVEHADAKAITQIPGIGKKMAERLILELRDKFQKLGKENISFAPSAPKGVSSDATAALINLGYKALDAEKAIKKILENHPNEPPLAELISLALKARI